MNALAAALLHATWQGSVLALLVATVSSLLTSARARSALALAGLAGLVAAPAVSLVLMLGAGGADLGAPARGTGVPGAAALGSVVDTGTRALFDGVALAGALVAIWVVGAALVLARLCLGLLGTRRLRRQGEPAPRDIRNAVVRAARRLGVRRPIDVLQSDRLDVPAALGGRRPTVIVPAFLGPPVSDGELKGAVDGGRSRAAARIIPGPELYAILAHEVAHLRRRDWGTNLAQSVAEALLWFHPAAWWLSERARREREFACDDLAAGTSEGRVRLARALATLETGRSRLGLAMSSNAGPLLARVARLLAGPDRCSRSHLRSPGRWAATAGALALAVGAAWLTIVALPASARFTMGALSTLSARDDAGSFTLSFRGGRVVHATMDGEVVPTARLRQTADSLYFLDSAGEVDFGVRVQPSAAGITWRSRPSPTGAEHARVRVASGGVRVGVEPPE